jgi:hypothetical protein
MRLENYSITFDDKQTTFDFISEGENGNIKKRIQFQSVNNKGLYNLAFGDFDVETNDFDDTVVTNNGDSQKILATVALSVFIFMEKYPIATVFAAGSTPSRTRLYKIGISNNIEEWQQDFNIFGFNEQQKWTIFKKEDSYSAFYIKRKI